MPAEFKVCGYWREGIAKYLRVNRHKVSALRKRLERPPVRLYPGMYITLSHLAYYYKPISKGERERVRIKYTDRAVTAK